MKPSFRVCGTIFWGFSIALCAQNPHPKELAAPKGTIAAEDLYYNPALSLSLPLAGASSSAVPQQQTESKIAQVSAEQASPNSTEGLHELLNNLLLTARNDDGTKLRTQIADMEIPNYEAWFTHTFGQEKGKTSANAYGKFQKMNELYFELLWTELAKQDGQILIEKVDSTKKYGMSADPPHEYKATWKKTDSSVGPQMQAIGLFDYVEGKFRLLEFLHEVRILRPNKAGAASPGRLDKVSPAKLIDKVQPVYPETAHQMRIQGTVALNVIIQRDGTVTVQNVGAGHPLLAPAAVAAVKQWRYEPFTINGEPFDIETKVHVIFELSRQQGEQKQ